MTTMQMRVVRTAPEQLAYLQAELTKAEQRHNPTSIRLLKQAIKEHIEEQAVEAEKVAQPYILEAKKTLTALRKQQAIQSKRAIERGEPDPNFKSVNYTPRPGETVGSVETDILKAREAFDAGLGEVTLSESGRQKLYLFLRAQPSIELRDSRVFFDALNYLNALRVFEPGELTVPKPVVEETLEPEPEPFYKWGSKGREKQDRFHYRSELAKERFAQIEANPDRKRIFDSVLRDLCIENNEENGNRLLNFWVDYQTLPFNHAALYKCGRE